MTRGRLEVRTSEVSWRGVRVGNEGAATILLIHGFPEDRRSWAPQLEPLARAGYRAVAVDLPGIGASTPPSSYRLEHLSAVLAELAASLDPRGVHLVGHDWGAILAASASARTPEAFRSVTLSGGPHPDAFRDALRSPRQLLRSWYVAAFNVPGAAVAIGARRGAAARALFGVRTPIDGRAAARRALAYYRENIGPRTVARHRVGRIEIPALVIHGALDRFVGVPLMDASARRCDDLRGFHLLPCGHFVHRDRPDEWRRLLLPFLASVEGMSGGIRRTKRR